jgi:hypothetical protein
MFSPIIYADEAKSRLYYISRESTEFIFDFRANRVITLEMFYSPPIYQWLRAEYGIQNVVINDTKWRRITTYGIPMTTPNLFNKSRIIDEHFFGDKLSHIVDYDIGASLWRSSDAGTSYTTKQYKNGESLLIKTPSHILPADSQRILNQNRLSKFSPFLAKLFLLRNINKNRRICVYIEATYLSII